MYICVDALETWLRLLRTTAALGPHAGERKPALSLLTDTCVWRNVISLKATAGQSRLISQNVEAVAAGADIPGAQRDPDSGVEGRK